MLAFVVLILSATAVSSALRIKDRKTIATFRRVQATILAGEILWLVFAAVGAVYAWTSGSTSALTNAILFGAFICAGFEFLVIHGAFENSASISLSLAAIHPISTLLIVRLPELAGRLDVVAFSSGFLALAILVAFPLLLKGKKTSLGYDALSLFHAFMKTWTTEDSDQLEGMIAGHSEEMEVSTKVLLFRTKVGDAFLILPGVHPGPFYPIGSYDLPGVVSVAFRELGPAMTLHRPGGHERNLATKADTSKYALAVKELALSIEPTGGGALMRGPTRTQVGNAVASALAFSEDLMMTMSFAPLGSDDIDATVEDQLSRSAVDAGLDLTIVDAHNSIDPRLQSPMTDDPGWRKLFETMSKAEPHRFAFAYSHSNEIGFSGSGDITENGVGLIMLQSEGPKSVLVLADANNSVPSLHAEVEKALNSAGYSLVEFCTSDSHNLAARGLTAERGYKTLGESTPVAAIAEATVKLARLAETRLAPAEYGSAKMNSKVRVFGAKALEEFASITQESSKFSRSYFRFATAAVAGLFLVSIFF